MTIDAFYHDELSRWQNELFPTATVTIITHLADYLKLNIEITADTFIAIRFNAENGRQDFALIHKNQRIFGYDNLKQWHYHPLEDPSEHIQCPMPSIGQILTEMKAIIEQL